MLKRLDLRMPWTRERDDVTDLIVAAVIRECLRSHPLNEYRKMAMFDKAPSGEDIPRKDQFVTREVVKSEAMRIQITLDRRLTPQVDRLWGICLEVFAPNFDYPKQVERCQDALRRHIATQEHLSPPAFRYEEDHNRLTAAFYGQIGYITETVPKPAI